MFGSPDGDPHDGEAMVARLAAVLQRARDAKIPVFFVQQIGAPGNRLEPSGDGFAWREELTPLPGESVTQKHYCNAFQATDLETTLREAGIGRLVVGGLQSEFCVNTAVLGAFERGFQVTLIADGHSTFDTPVLSAAQIIAHHNQTLSSGMFAKLITADQAFA